MANEHDIELKDLMVQLQDGTRIQLGKDEFDQLVTGSYEPTEGTKHAGITVGTGDKVLGFGPWPSWGANIMNRTATLPDEESGLFEPERLFVLREQYMFLEGGDKPRSFGPIHKAWWAGTEHIVQARRVTGRH